MQDLDDVERLAMDVAADVVERLRAIGGRLPEVVEEQAWVGTRWRVRSKTFAHVLLLDGGWPEAYGRASGLDGTATLLMVRSAPPELEALRSGGPPFFAPPWRADEVGMVLGHDVDWQEVAELVTDSYCTVAPKKLAEQVDRPAE